MATSNRIRALNRLPFDFQDGLKVGGVDVTNLNQAFTPAGAGLIGFTPVGNLSAGNVQAALAELDNEKVGFARLDDTDGSSLVGYDGGTVQDVLDAVTGPTGAASVGYTPAGTGAVATTVEQVLDETVSVFRFMTEAQIADVQSGAASVDVTAAIQAALDSVGSTGGGTVRIPAGSYAVTSLILKHSGIRVVGDGDATKLFNTQAFSTMNNYPTFWVARSNCSIENLFITYKNWNSVNLASLISLGAIPGGTIDRGSQITVGFSELYTAASSGAYKSYRGVTLQVVSNVTVEDVTILGAAVHAIPCANVIGMKVKNNRISQVRGTSIYGFITPSIEVSKNTIESTTDDAVFLQNPITHLDGVYTPILISELVDCKILNNTVKKVGAKAFGVTAINGVLIDGNFVSSCRANSIYIDSDVSGGSTTAPSNVVVSNNTILDCFGGYGAASDGYRYSSDILTAAPGIYYALQFGGVTGFTVANNVVSCTTKLDNVSVRGFIGSKNNFKGRIANNQFYGFARNALGNESSSSPVTKDIVFESNLVESSSVNPLGSIRLLQSGYGAMNLVVQNNLFRSAAPANAIEAAIWGSIDSQTYDIGNTYDLPGGLASVGYDTPVSFFITTGKRSYADAGKGLLFSSRTMIFKSSVPTVGTWAAGDVVYNDAPTAGGFVGWVCVTGGTPGTWKTFGAISA